MTKDSKNKEKELITPEYLESERRLTLARKEIERLQKKTENLQHQLEIKEEKIQTLLSHINQ